MTIDPPLTMDEIQSLLALHARALMTVSELTDETLLLHVQRIEQLYLLLKDKGS